jgi:hypothetical protein
VRIIGEASGIINCAGIGEGLPRQTDQTCGGNQNVMLNQIWLILL